jgi:hypothetical protein
MPCCHLFLLEEVRRIGSVAPKAGNGLAKYLAQFSTRAEFTLLSPYAHEHPEGGPVHGVQERFREQASAEGT